jgi:hypothetical protein
MFSGLLRGHFLLAFSGFEGMGQPADEKAQNQRTQDNDGLGNRQKLIPQELDGRIGILPVLYNKNCQEGADDQQPERLHFRHNSPGRLVLQVPFDGIFQVFQVR